jgi:hypothetical protein
LLVRGEAWKVFDGELRLITIRTHSDYLGSHNFVRGSLLVS